MKKIWFCALVLLCILAVFISVLWFFMPQLIQPQQPSPQWILRDDSGRLARYSAQDDSLQEVYEIYTRLLPEQDFLALQDGIPITSEAELQALLEDFGL